MTHFVFTRDARGRLCVEELFAFIIRGKAAKSTIPTIGLRTYGRVVGVRKLEPQSRLIDFITACLQPVGGLDDA
jgi:hypothetical protein